MKNNPKFGSMELSGQDTSDKPSVSYTFYLSDSKYLWLYNLKILYSRFLFFLDIRNVTQSLKICVKQCPDRTLWDMNDICTFYKETGSQLCHDRPGGDFSACNSESSKFKNGSCPKPPIYPSIPVLNRCIPKAVQDVSETIISNLYGLINSWDVIKQVLGDLYKTWRQILALSFLACGKKVNAHCYIIIHASYIPDINLILFF